MTGYLPSENPGCISGVPSARGDRKFHLFLDGCKATLDDGLSFPVAFPELLQVYLVAPKLVQHLLQVDADFGLRCLVVGHVANRTLLQPTQSSYLRSVVPSAQPNYEQEGAKDQAWGVVVMALETAAMTANCRYPKAS